MTIHEPLLECDYFDADLCHSCTLIKTPQDIQRAAKTQRVAELVDAAEWLEPFASTREAFRNKVKLVVTGTIRHPKLGILGDGNGVDLRDCPLPTAGIRTVIPLLAQFVTRAKLQPYNLHTDTGVLKNIIITESPDAELMVRFVVRRRGAQGIIFKLRDELLATAPNIAVLSINVQPDHKAILEGDEEIVVTERSTLPMRLNIGQAFAPLELPLELRPQSFFQTNTDAAAHLYRTARDWIGSADVVWDLYSGVGGFALALALKDATTTKAPVRTVVGIETSEQAVAAAEFAARQMGAVAEFIAADATQWVTTAEALAMPQPDVVIVNPPRRGIGAELAGWIENSGIKRVFYSSCNAETLARDLTLMPSLRVVKAQSVEMFPHTEHVETVVLLSRK